MERRDSLIISFITFLDYFYFKRLLKIENWDLKELKGHSWPIRQLFTFIYAIPLPRSMKKLGDEQWSIELSDPRNWGKTCLYG